jgi:hypothetical protein
MGQGVSYEGIMRMDDTRYGYSVVRLCKGAIEGQTFFAFVAVEPHNLDYFRQNYKAGTHTHFSPFGTELLRGWGGEPEPHIAKHVEEKFGVCFCNDEFSAEAAAQMVRHDLSLAHINVFGNQSKDTAKASRSLIERVRQTLEKPARLFG